MLARTDDLPCRRLEADVHQLPFADRAFDLVVSAWVIETVSDPVRAVSELLRVLDVHGLLVHTRTCVVLSGARVRGIPRS